jgi:hypothetical protein
MASNENWYGCETCGRWPAIAVRVRSTGGVIAWRSLRTTRYMALCKECGLQLLHRSQAVAPSVGLATVNVFAPYALVQNGRYILRLKALPDPEIPTNQKDESSEWEPGWYEDFAYPKQERWYDGNQWTRRTRRLAPRQ